ncbi:MAG TPA: GNAT family N-acetyltransferase [Galbitalea sp.]|jgi:GNAT superfamily N-acetyltransferase|nr:GNAT family N-acetyltransferase [Galbitalea sp.]
MDFRLATSDDVEEIARILTLAFLDDPVWGPALARPDGVSDHLDPFWRIYAEGSLRHGGAYVTDGATALWTPPGETELSDTQEAELMDLLHDTFAGDDLDALLELYDRFDAAHPHDVPHAYLGLLATHPNSRGHGIAQQLLAENLRGWDARGIPAYLESTNPANDHRYQRAGFRSVGSISAVLSDARITTMWREPR